MSKSEPERDLTADGSAQTNHLERMSDGCGCTEVWEELSEYREQTD